MAISEGLVVDVEKMILSNGLNSLEVTWLKENRPDILRAIHSERISLERLTEHFGITSLWHTHFRSKILRQWKELFDEHGLIAFTHKWLTDKKKSIVYTSLSRHGLTMAASIESMGFTHEFLQFKGPNTGKFLWTREKFEEVTRKIIKEFGCFPPGEFLDKHGYGGLRSNIGRFGPTCAEIRKRHKVQNIVLQSLDKQIWLSLPEVNFANYLVARGIKVIKGRPYPVRYSDIYDRKRGIYDMHFIGTVEPYKSRELSVEIFGTGNYGGDNIRKKHYAETRKFKEDFHKGDDTFVAVEYKDCYSDIRLAKLLTPFIGDPEVRCGTSVKFNTTMASVQEQVLQQCKDIKMKLKTDRLPSSAWFDRTGPYKNRHIHDWEPRSFAKLVSNIERLKFTEVRKLLGESDIPSHRIWSEAEVISDFRATMAKYGVQPSTLYGRLSRSRRENPLSEDDALLLSQMSKLSNAVAKFFKGRQNMLLDMGSII